MYFFQNKKTFISNTSTTIYQTDMYCSKIEMMVYLFVNRFSDRLFDWPMHNQALCIRPVFSRKYKLHIFNSIGLWEVCLNGFHDMRHQYDIKFYGCKHILLEEYDIIREELMPCEYFFIIAYILLKDCDSDFH